MNVEYLLVSVGAPSALQCQIHMCLEWTKLVYNKEWVQMHIATTVSFFFVKNCTRENQAVKALFWPLLDPKGPR